jgi:hypothetical protein
VAVVIREPQLLSEEDIAKFAGRWVAIKEGKVIKDAEDPALVVKRLERESITPDIVRHIPTEAEPGVWIL